MKKLTKKQKAERQRLMRDLDAVFSRYVRRKDADSSGRVKCITCDRKEHWKLMDAGHFFPRKRMATRWHLANVKPQCKMCNQLQEGNLDAYKKALGVEETKYLKILSNQAVSWDNKELSIMIKHFTNQLNRLNAKQPQRNNKR